ncbi:MAG: RNA polymerase sigma factor [Candidatus Omnitrophica bacterium]|nr:RNA polymerase sigma factor [Candidatus Omnitrophota bacterium]
MDYFDEDAQLMLRFKDGEESCFEQLVERHKQRVFNLAYRFFSDYQQAEDISQQVFIKLYYAKHTYTPKAKFTTWLYAICRNTCLKILRVKTPKMLSIDYSKQLEEKDVLPQIADTKIPRPDTVILDKERQEIIKAALDSLPENQKMAVILNRYEELSYEEIAGIMGCSQKAVKSLVHRARLNLKEKLAVFYEKT